MADLTKLVEMHESIPDSGLYRVTQYLHDAAAQYLGPAFKQMPESVQNLLPDSLQGHPATVMFEGFAGAYLLTRFLQMTSKYIVGKMIPGFDKKLLPALEKLCIAGLPLAFFAYTIVDPEGAKGMLYSKPMDNAGIVAAYLGGVLAAVPDLHKRSKHAISKIKLPPQPPS
jgi:hypothetical protein